MVSLTDIVIVRGDFNLPNLFWEQSETDCNAFLPTNVRSETEVLFCYSLLELDLRQVNGTPNLTAHFSTSYSVQKPMTFQQGSVTFL